MLEQFAHHWPLLVLIAPALALLWILAVFIKYIRLMLNIFRDTPLPVLSGSDYPRLEGQPVWFRSFDGTRLRGMFLTRSMLNESGTAEANSRDQEEPPLSPSSRGIVIFCHELGSDRRSATRYCRGLLEAGFDVFSFDFRGHGDSANSTAYQPRLWCTDKEVADCLGALLLVDAWIRARHLSVGIGLFGISRGGSAAVLAAAEARGYLPVRAVVTDGAFSSDFLVETYLRKWVHIFARVRFVYENHPPVFWRLLRFILLKLARLRFHCEFPSLQKSLDSIRRTALFFIHGEKDSYIPADQATRLFDGAALPRYLWVVPDARHNQAVARDPDGYFGRTVTFFERHVAGASACAESVETPESSPAPRAGLTQHLKSTPTC